MSKYNLLRRAVQTEVLALNSDVFGLDDLILGIIDQIGLDESLDQTSHELGSQIYDLIAGWVIGDVEG